ncbi:MAG TPA: TonB-dependent receptor, partial [Opitutaceae bacterium]|nr:TonB-dependent receptor [Opitutaceae bacterium]
TPVGPVNDTYSIFGKYEFTSETLKGFGFGAGVRGQGDWIGPNIRAGVPSSFQGYEVFNVLATYQNDRFKVQLNVDNVGDKIYVEGYELAYWIFTSKGREIKLSASYRF